VILLCVAYTKIQETYDIYKYRNKQLQQCFVSVSS